MGRTIGALCVMIVCLQILIGVPIVVCVVFLGMAGGRMGPVAVEVHAPIPTIGAAPMGLPPNLIPPSVAVPWDNPILASRAEHGSPLAGTVLGESVPPETERDLFVAAFEKVAAENPDGPRATTKSPSEGPAPNEPLAAADTCARPISTAPPDVRESAAQFAVSHLYAMAQVDEDAGEYERADQWRSLAREIRCDAATSMR